MKKQKGHTGKLVLLLLAAAMIKGCVEEYDLSLENYADRIVVYGSVTDQPGPYVIRLGRTNSYGEAGVDKPESGAIVYVSDDEDNTEFFDEVSPGTYKSDPASFRGEAGKTYKLHIETADCEEYVSEPALMEPVSTIDSTYYKVKTWTESETIQGKYYEITKDAIEIYSVTRDPSQPGNHYRWQVSTWEEVRYNDQTDTYKMIELSKDRSDLDTYLGIGIDWYVFENNCAARCYRFNPGNDFYIDDDLQWNGSVLHTPVTVLKNNNYDIVLIIEQMSLSSKAYRFYSQLKEQFASVGSIYDPISTRINGNIRNVNNPLTYAVGFFNVSAVDVDTVFLERSRVEKPVSRPGCFDSAIPPGDCRTFPPDFWTVANLNRWDITNAAEQ